MSSRLAALAPRLLALAVAAVVSASATITFAAVKGTAPAPLAVAVKPQVPELLVVPRVIGQAYVFAKGILEESGFAWRVAGRVDGYAANVVARQDPAAGTSVVDTGAPTVTVYLQRNAKYRQQGTPENFSPYEGTGLRVPGRALRKPGSSQRGNKLAPSQKGVRSPARKTAVEKVTPGGAPVRPAPRSARTHARPVKTRPAAFDVPGAPKEPLDEMSLPDRARLLGRWLEAHPTKSEASVEHWLYQHAWLTYGARFGWWHGAEALRILIGVDERVQKLWGIGAESEADARAALAEVRARTS